MCTRRTASWPHRSLARGTSLSCPLTRRRVPPCRSRRGRRGQRRHRLEHRSRSPAASTRTRTPIRRPRRTAPGYVALLAWLRALGALVRAGRDRGHRGIRLGLARYLQAEGVPLVEVDRPDRKARRWQGKSDPVDAEAAARAALALTSAPAPAPRSSARDGWKRCGRCGWPDAARSRTVLTCSGSSKRWPSPRPRTCAKRCAACRRPAHRCLRRGAAGPEGGR